ncbi:choice-of-anchor E domain-containing protein [Pannus brasiliensis CCIBt3594]|uniref:Choice-of-anchor E domain-containing protein n=1 Tax=Pannus brasiliensis CCIBt3594 TaxID=1427578 RepID=A0AAW9QQ36_9CHRO
MKTLSNVLASSAVAVATIYFGGVAQAATLSGGSFTKSPQTTEINQTGSLGKFDPNLGTLTSVAFSFTGQYRQQFTVTNRASTTQNNVRVITSTDIFASLVGGPALSPNSLSFAVDTGRQTYTAGQTRSFGPFTDSKSFLTTFTSPATLAFFTGLGTFDVNCISLSSTTISGGGGNINTTQNTTAACGASIEYTYTPAPTPPVGTPEPGTVLGLLAVAGVGTFARREG